MSFNYYSNYKNFEQNGNICMMPNNQEALMYFERTMQLRNRAVHDYTVKYGPISQYEVNTSQGWTWNKCPLPWNGGM